MATGVGAGENLFEPLGYAFAGGRVDAAWRLRCRRRGPRDQHIGFGLLVGVEELKIGVGERCGGVKHYGKRRYAEAGGVVAEQRAQRGGDDIGATAHGFGEDDIGGAGGHAIESVDEVGEAAAEAAASDLVGSDAVGLDEVGVHQVVALIVEDGSDTHSLALKDAGGGEDEAWSSLPRESLR